MSRFTARSAEQNQGCFEEFRTDSLIYGGFLCWFPNYVLTYFLFFWIPNHQMVVSNLWFLVHPTWDDDPITSVNHGPPGTDAEAHFLIKW
jgi:hypothetical protein